MEYTDIEATENTVASYRILSFRSCAPKEYEGFVYAGWLNSLRFGNDMFKLMDGDTYYAAYKIYIESVLKRPASRLRIAVLTDDEDVALGWAVDEGKTLHYMYVPKDYRKKGIGASLLSPSITTISHITKIGLSIWVNKFPQWKLNPFA